MTDVTYPAAWVPDQISDTPDPEQAAQLVVDWVLQEAERLQTQPLLITTSKDVWTLGLAPITCFTSTYPATTPRARNPRSGSGPVLVYLPDYKLMHMAANCAQGHLS